MSNLIEQLASRVRALETDEPPIVPVTGAGAVATPPTQLQMDAAFGATAAQLRDGWTGLLYDAGGGNTWLCVSEADTWFVVGSGGGIPGVPHNILSATHLDTLAAAVSRGSLIYGNATPLWAELVHPGAANRILRTPDVNDVSWSDWALVGTAAQTYTFPATGCTLQGGTGTAGQVAYCSATANVLAGDAGMVYDAANDLLTVSGATATRAILQSADAATVTATFPLRLDHITSAAAGIGFGVGAEAYLEADNGTDYLAGSIAWRWWGATFATRRAQIELRADYAGTNPLVGVIVSGINCVDGNARAAGAVDLQTYRSAVAQVASGNYSFLCGSYNTASGGGSFCAGQNSTASNTCSVALGSYCVASGVKSFALGANAQAIHDGAIVMADNSLFSGFASTAANQFAVRCNSGAWFAATELAAAPGVFSLLTLEGRVTGAGAGAAGDGIGITYFFESATNGNYRHMGDVQFQWRVATDATRQSQLRLWGEYAGTSCPIGTIVSPASSAILIPDTAWGTGAVDFGTYKGLATEVASGSFATICGGFSGTASGDYSIILGGRNCTASAAYAAACGYRSVADKYGQFAHASGRVVSDGDTQDSILHVRREITTHVDTTWYTLYIDGAAVLLTIAADTCWTFRAMVVGLTAGAAQRWCYEIVGGIVNDGGTTSLLAQTITTLYESDALYDVQAAADDANDALLIQVRRDGATDYNIIWSSAVYLDEVTHV